MDIIVILNYVTRIMTIILGIMILLNPWNMESGKETIIQTLGVIAIVFGAFRLFTYHKRLQMIKRQEESENDESDDETEEKQ